MTKNSHIVLILFTFFSYGQNIVFEPNTNHKSRHLFQGLNKTQDSLILENDEIIRTVDIFNEVFFNSFDIDSTKAKIDLNVLPIGSFIIKARIGRQHIVMTLDKSSIQNTMVVTSISTETNTLSQLPWEKVDADEKTLYWIVHESNGGFGANKSMKLQYKHEVSNMIAKIKLELKSKNGRRNKLMVYEIYDRSKFMTEQLRNHSYYKSKKSQFFNVEPYAFIN